MFLGKLLKDVGDDPAAALAILIEARDLRPAEPAAWLADAAKKRRPKYQPTYDFP